MQACQSVAHCFQATLTQHFFYARKYYIFLEADMIVEQFSEMRHPLRLNWNFCGKLLLEIQNGGANFRVVGKYAHHVGVLIEPRMPGICWQ